MLALCNPTGTSHHSTVRWKKIATGRLAAPVRLPTAPVRAHGGPAIIAAYCARCTASQLQLAYWHSGHFSKSPEQRQCGVEEKETLLIACFRVFVTRLNHEQLPATLLIVRSPVAASKAQLLRTGPLLRRLAQHPAQELYEESPIFSKKLLLTGY
ncbi:unnamed protein product [Diplocarpon coronariae]